MQIIVYTTSSDPRKIDKQKTLIATLSGSLRNVSEVVTPIVTIEYATEPNFNYAYIGEFGRYYFVTDYKAVRTGIWEIKLKCDVLMSFDLTGVSGIVKETQSVNGNDYLDGRNWIANVKDKTDIKVFPYGLLDSGEFILITAGG